MAEQDDELARLLEHARADVGSAEVLAEVRDKVVTSIATGPGLTDGGASATGTLPAAAVKLALPLKLAASIVAAGAVVAALVTVNGHKAAPAAAPAQLPKVAVQPIAPAWVVAGSPALEPEVAMDMPAEPAREPKVKKRAARKAIGEPLADAPAPAADVAPAPASFAEEVELIKAALAAQRQGRIDDARSKLAEHAQRFPEGQLTHERTRIEALLSQ